MVGLVKSVEICVGRGTSALEVFSANEASVYVNVGEGYGAELFKVKVEEFAYGGG